MEINSLEYTPNYIKLTLNRKVVNFHTETGNAERWCYQTVCGKRVNNWTFAFKNEAEYMMFKLKWL